MLKHLISKLRKVLFQIATVINNSQIIANLFLFDCIFVWLFLRLKSDVSSGNISFYWPRFELAFVDLWRQECLDCSFMPCLFSGKRDYIIRHHEVITREHSEEIKSFQTNLAKCFFHQTMKHCSLMVMITRTWFHCNC